MAILLFTCAVVELTQLSKDSVMSAGWEGASSHTTLGGHPDASGDVGASVVLSLLSDQLTGLDVCEGLVLRKTCREDFFEKLGITKKRRNLSNSSWPRNWKNWVEVFNLLQLSLLLKAYGK